MPGKQLILSETGGKELQRLLTLVVAPIGKMEPAVFGGLVGCWTLAVNGDVAAYRRRLSAAVAGHIIRHWVRGTARKLMEQRYRGLDQVEQCVVIHHAAVKIRPKLSEMAEVINCYLQTESVLIVEGFATFRIPGLRDDIYDAVDEGVDAVLLDREYKEFLQIISRVVKNQPRRCSRVHVVLNHSGLFRLISDDGNPMELSGIPRMDSDGWASTGTRNRDDILISALVALSPKSVVIHDCSPIKCLALAPHAAARKERLEIVFGDSVAVCSGCDLCWGGDK